MTDKEFKEAVIDYVAEGNISEIEKLINMIDIDELKDEYDFLISDDTEEEEEI